MPLPYPYKIYPDVTCITPDELRRMNIEGIMLDIDGTLLRSCDSDVPPPADEWVRALSASGVAVFLLSNNKSPERVGRLARLFNVPWSHLSGKPRRRGFERACEVLGLPACSVAVVGDQIFTDMLLAARCGVKGLLVHSLDDYRLFCRARMILEKPFRKEKRK